MRREMTGTCFTLGFPTRRRRRNIDFAAAITIKRVQYGQYAFISPFTFTVSSLVSSPCEPPFCIAAEFRTVCRVCYMNDAMAPTRSHRHFLPPSEMILGTTQVGARAFSSTRVAFIRRLLGVPLWSKEYATRGTSEIQANATVYLN